MEYPLLSATGWIVRGAERELSSAYEIAQWDAVNSSRYNELIVGRTAAQVFSLNSVAEFLSELLESEDDLPDGVVFQVVDNELVVTDKDGNDLTYIHYPKAWHYLEYFPLEDSDDGVYVLSGKASEDDVWEISTYSSQLENAAQYAITNDSQYIGQTAREALVATLMRKIYNGYAGDGVPYMKFQPESRERWSIVDKDGGHITGIAYDSLADAASIVMRIYDFCGAREANLPNQANNDVATSARAGLSIAGVAISGVSVS